MNRSNATLEGDSQVNPQPDLREQFTEKLTGTLNSAGLAMMISIGHRNRLFDVMAGMEPASSRHIAQRAELKERYVREWLGAMVTAGVVEYDPQERTYHLPAVHASLLTCCVVFTVPSRRLERC
jgi:hypothetical protein